MFLCCCLLCCVGCFILTYTRWLVWLGVGWMGGFYDWFDVKRFGVALNLYLPAVFVLLGVLSCVVVFDLLLYLFVLVGVDVSSGLWVVFPKLLVSLFAFVFDVILPTGNC